MKSTTAKKMDHVPRPLPDPSEYPYGVVMILVWTPNPGVEKQWTGHTYVNQDDGWRRTYGAFLLPPGYEADWEFDGFRIDGFSRRFLLQENQNPGPLVRLAMWALERWAKDKGLV